MWSRSKPCFKSRPASRKRLVSVSAQKVLCTSLLLVDHEAINIYTSMLVDNDKRCKTTVMLGIPVAVTYLLVVSPVSDCLRFVNINFLLVC